MGSLLRATNLWGYSDLVQELGGDPTPLLRRFGIAAGVENEQDAFISYEAVARMVEASAADLHCPDFGLRLARWQGLDILGPIAVIARNAETLLGALEAIARYLFVHSPALTLSAAPRGGDCDIRFTYTVTEPGLPYLPQAYELGLANGARIIRLLSGSEGAPSVISFKHEQLGSDDAYRQALGCPVLFSQSWSGFELSPALADRIIDNADAETRRIATKYLESQYPPNTATLSQRVTELTRRLLPTGQCSADAIADELAMHPRTLHRRLADEGARCQDLVDQERRTQAVRYLAEPRLHLQQIAGLLGYTEQSTLNRSCRRWFDKTPRQYRAYLAAASSPNPPAGPG